VEVAGIEPASENLSHKASTCLVGVFKFNLKLLPSTGSATSDFALISFRHHEPLLELAY
jgi:hypothetical protein